MEGEKHVTMVTYVGVKLSVHQVDSEGKTYKGGEYNAGIMSLL